MDRGKLSEYERSIKKEIANNIKVLLHQENMTQKQLSEKTGIPTSTISDYLNENSLAKTINVKRIAIALGVTKDRIDPRFSVRLEMNIYDDSRIKFLQELEQELILILQICLFKINSREQLKLFLKKIRIGF